MKTSKPVRCFLILIWVLIASGSAQDVVSIFGFIYDWNGGPVKRAAITLKKCGYTTLSNDSGYFKFDTLGCATTQTKGSKSPSFSYVKPRSKSDGIYVSTVLGGERVSIILFTLSGKKAGEIITTLASPGNYRVNPFAQVKISQVYLARVQVGDVVTILKVPVAVHRPLSINVIEPQNTVKISRGNPKLLLF